MSDNDIQIVDVGGHAGLPTYQWQVASGAAASIGPGEPLKMSASASQYVVLQADADLTIGTDQPMPGVAANTSTDTTSADGVVQVWMPLPGVIYRVRALTAGLADTASEINALIGEYDVIDLTSSAFTLDTAAGSGANNAYLIVGGEATISSLHVMLRSDATVFGRGSV